MKQRCDDLNKLSSKNFMEKISQVWSVKFFFCCSMSIRLRWDKNHWNPFFFIGYLVSLFKDFPTNLIHLISLKMRQNEQIEKCKHKMSFLEFRFSVSRRFWNQRTVWRLWKSKFTWISFVVVKIFVLYVPLSLSTRLIALLHAQQI